MEESHGAEFKDIIKSRYQYIQLFLLVMLALEKLMYSIVSHDKKYPITLCPPSRYNLLLNLSLWTMAKSLKFKYGIQLDSKLIDH
jgi:hypothetical protein